MTGRQSSACANSLCTQQSCLCVVTLLAATQPDLWPSVGPYLPQLHSLIISSVYWDNWANACLQSQYTTHTLTHLHIPTQMCRRLASLIVAYAPALTTLVVSRLEPARVPRRKYRAVHWSVRTLRLTDSHFNSASALKWLPTPKEGKMVIEMCGPMDVELPLQERVSRCGTVQPYVHTPVKSTQHHIHETSAAPELTAWCVTAFICICRHCTSRRARARVPFAPTLHIPCTVRALFRDVLYCVLMW